MHAWRPWRLQPLLIARTGHPRSSNPAVHARAVVEAPSVEVVDHEQLEPRGPLGRLGVHGEHHLVQPHAKVDDARRVARVDRLPQQGGVSASSAPRGSRASVAVGECACGRARAYSSVYACRMIVRAGCMVLFIAHHSP